MANSVELKREYQLAVCVLIINHFVSTWFSYMTSNWLDLQNDFSEVLNGVETAAVANCLCSAWESSHAQLLYIPYNTSPGSMHIPDLCFALYHWPGQLPSSSFLVSYNCVNMGSVKLPVGGVHAMNNVVLTKWRIALSTTSECLRITEEWFEWSQ